MKTLVAKEIRLLLPAFVAALALAILPIWLVPNDPWQDMTRRPVLWPAYLYLFATVLLALTTFGREVALNTLPFILSQPVERARIWWTKIAVLAVAVGVVFDAWLTSGNIRSAFRPALCVPPGELAAFGVFTLIFVIAGLWMILLVRQVAVAFWLSLLLPLIPLSAIIFITTITNAAWLFFAAAGLCAVTGFLLARRQFLHVQDTAWTGGMIVFSGKSALRRYDPWKALFWKEMRLQQATLLGMAGLLVLHLGAVALRKAGAHTFARTTLMVLDGFGALWFIMPVLAGSQSVAEERKFGTMQAHLCLPVSRRVQWFVKLILTLVVGGLLSFVLFWSVESLGKVHPQGADSFFVIGSLFVFLALAGFYGSTLTGGLLQAVAAAVLTGAAFWALLEGMTDPQLEYLHGTLPWFIGGPILVGSILWLACRNFENVTESWRLWRRNALVLLGMSALTFALTVGIYHRAWEWLTPLEAPPGPPRMSLDKPPRLYSYGGSGLAAVLPNGSLWVDRLERGSEWPFDEKWRSLGGSGFLAGSNWVDAIVNYRETVAIRSDGTLWVSEKPRTYWAATTPLRVEPSAPLVQFGEETNWLSVARHPDWAVFLLKRDGTLWDWGTNTINSKQAQPSLRNFAPRRLGKDSDWAKLIGKTGWFYAFAWKTDGSAWLLHYPSPPYPIPENPPDSGTLPGRFQGQEYLAPEVVLSRLPDLNNSRWRSLMTGNDRAFAGVRADGTLWCFNYFSSHERHWPGQNSATAVIDWPGRSTKAGSTNGWNPVQIGKDSDWAELARSGSRLVARKNDGSLWEWKVTDRFNTEPLEVLRKSPARMGTRGDWIALCVVDGYITSLAADGDLWSWPHWEAVAVLGDKWGLYIAASRKPARIENIFGQQ